MRPMLIITALLLSACAVSSSQNPAPSAPAPPSPVSPTMPAPSPVPPAPEPSPRPDPKPAPAPVSPPAPDPVPPPSPAPAPNPTPAPPPLPSGPTSAQKQLLRAQGRSVQKAGNALLIFHPALKAQGVAPALQAACLKGASELVVGGQTYSLIDTDEMGNKVDFRFGPLSPASGGQGCQVGPAGDQHFTVTLTGPDQWRTVNGEYPLDDPENLTDAEQDRNGRGQSRRAYTVSVALLAEDPAALPAEVAALVEPLCLQGFDHMTMRGVTYNDALSAAPIGLTKCIVEPLEDVVRVTVTTANGGTYVNGVRQ